VLGKFVDSGQIVAANDMGRGVGFLYFFDISRAVIGRVHLGRRTVIVSRSGATGYTSPLVTRGSSVIL